MATHEISRNNWKSFLEDFSKRHELAEVEVDAVSPQSGVRPETHWLPFTGIEFEDKGSEAGTIRLLTVTEIGDNTIEITAPRQIYHKPGAGVLSDEVTENEILEITSSDDPPITYLRFRKRA
jgi:hypothetical protein